MPLLTADIAHFARPKRATAAARIASLLRSWLKAFCPITSHWRGSKCGGAAENEGPAPRQAPHSHRALLVTNRNENSKKPKSKEEKDDRNLSDPSPDPNSKLPTLDQALSAARELFGRMEAEPSSCGLRVVVVSEGVGDLAMAALFPVAAVRNVALLALDTPRAAMVREGCSVGMVLAHWVLILCDSGVEIHVRCWLHLSACRACLVASLVAAFLAHGGTRIM